MHNAPLRRWLPLLIALAGVLLVFAIPALQVTKWVGRKTLPVEVRISDSDSLDVVVGAEVTMFDGPQSHMEGPVSGRKLTDFVPDPESPTTKKALTDSDGIARFEYAFWTAGSDGPWENSGYVDTSCVWVRILAPDRLMALVPLDRQSVRPRDIHDLTPIVVTVVLNKSAADVRDAGPAEN